MKVVVVGSVVILICSLAAVAELVQAGPGGNTATGMQLLAVALIIGQLLAAVVQPQPKPIKGVILVVIVSVVVSGVSHLVQGNLSDGIQLLALAFIAGWLRHLGVVAERPGAVRAVCKSG